MDLGITRRRLPTGWVISAPRPEGCAVDAQMPTFAAPEYPTVDLQGQAPSMVRVLSRSLKPGNGEKSTSDGFAKDH